MHSRSVWVPSLYFLCSHLLSLSGCLYLPREMPLHFDSYISQSSITQPFDQWGPIMPSWYAVGGAHWVAAMHTVKPDRVI